jgi:SAM-dependent methyltransferase
VREKQLSDNLSTQSTTRAFWTFSSRIITPTVERLLPSPHTHHAVEIGYGDGALLFPASRFFGSVTGLSMGQGDATESARETLDTERCENVSLTGWEPSHSLPLEDSSADFIYSLHGVTRLPGLAAYQSLLHETARVLRPGGVAMLWFGRLSRLPFALPGKAWLRGYDVRSGGGAREPSLHIRMFHARRAVMSAGLKAPALSTPLHPDTSWRLLRGGGLSYITAWKPL